MKEQANLTPELKEKQQDLQMKFSRMSNDQRARVANYLNLYNTTAWLYNEVLSEDERIYIDLSMQYVVETQQLKQQMQNVENAQDVEQLVNGINHGE